MARFNLLELARKLRYVFKREYGNTLDRYGKDRPTLLFSVYLLHTLSFRHGLTLACRMIRIVLHYFSHFVFFSLSDTDSLWPVVTGKVVLELGRCLRYVFKREY